MARSMSKMGGDFEEVEIDADEPIYTTGVICRVLKIPVWVLKQLDSEDIVSPPRESNNASRLYSKREMKKVKHCWFYIKEQNVNMAGLKVILRIENGGF